MTEEQLNAIDTLRSKNVELAGIIGNATVVAASKTAELIGSMDDAKDVLDAMKVFETISKVHGLSPKETQANIQINAINGFEFIELDEEDIKQISLDEEFEEAEYDIELEEGIEGE